MPIFFEKIPSVIEKYANKKNSKLAEERVKESNNYSETYLIADKETIESTRVLVLNKFSSKINDFDKTLSESRFKFSSSLA